MFLGYIVKVLGFTSAGSVTDRGRCPLSAGESGRFSSGFGRRVDGTAIHEFGFPRGVSTGDVARCLALGDHASTDSWVVCVVSRLSA